MTVVGREAELGQLESALEEAASGAGSLCLVLGEAGIGKTFLAEETAARARSRGFRVVWGRSWEAGGAPAYWPWIQALRMLLAGPVHASSLGELVELAGIPVDDGADPSASRFARMDAVCAWLLREAAASPVLVVLEDLHAADPSSIQLFELLGPAIRTGRVAVLATARPEQLDADALRALGRDARTLAIGRLAPDAVRALAGGDDAEAAHVYEVTEGHPLFVVELLRHVKHGGALRPGHVPRTVLEIVERRLGELSAGDRDLLSGAAVRGREFTTDDVDGDADATGAALRRAEAAGIVLATAGAYRFRHILIRDALVAAMTPERRRERHGRLARRLADLAARGEAPWSEVALHAAQAGDVPDLARRAWLRAGDQALAELAPAEALDAFGRAEGADADLETRARVWIGRGRAYAALSRPEDARAAWERAVDAARELGDPLLLAEASLARGELYRYVHVDAGLVELLRGVLDRLPDDAQALRARVTARLAAAMQPAEDVHEPMRLAREAIALAESAGDDQTRLAVYGAASSALVDLAEPAERRAVNRAHADLAERLEAPAEAQRAYLRLTIDLVELGAVDEARRALARVEALAAARPSPPLQWRASAVRAAWALWTGDLSAAERHIEEGRAAGHRARDANAEITWTMQTAMRHRLAGDHVALSAMLPSLRALFAGSVLGGLSDAAVCAAALVAMDRAGELDTWFDADAVARCSLISDRTVIEPLCEVAAAREDAALARRMLDRLKDQQGFMTGGVTGMTFQGPVERCVALCEIGLGDHASAAAHMRAALRRVRVVGARAWEVVIGRELAALASDTALADQIATLARELGTSGRGADPRATITLTRSGASWSYRRGAREATIKHTRAIELLATLLAHPGRELHVLELLGASEVDAGDAGEVLDDAAIASYQERLVAIRAELDEADEWQDLGRRARLKEEYEALTRELAAAVGLGGRRRRSHGAAERARVNVRKRITDALRRIAAHDADGAELLERSIDTGMYCRYRPLPP